MKLVRHDSQGSLAKLLAASIYLQKDSTLILPGGSSAVALMTELATMPLPWDQIYVGVTDERCVPLDHADNNAGQIVRLMGNLPRLCPLWQAGKIGTLPPLPASITVLGMGTDGHFASIFPDTPWNLQETAPFTVLAPRKPRERVSLPVNILLQTQRLILLVCGAEKIRLCEEILSGLHRDLPLAKFLALTDKIEIHIAP